MKKWTLIWLGGTVVKASACQGRTHKRWGFNSWVGRLTEGGNSNLIQYSSLKNSNDKGAWQATALMTEQLSTHAHERHRVDSMLNHRESFGT